jgi:regulator of sigma E protease
MVGATAMTTLLAFLVTLAVLIVVHEFGHYWAATRCGVKVLQFSIGFGRALYTRRLGKDNTEFIIAAFPLGGYVRMLDEREAPVDTEELHRAFNRQSVWKRIIVVAAGPVANLLLAIVLYWILMMSGMPGLRPLLGDVPAGSPAAQASMKANELIVRVGKSPVATWQDVRWNLLQEALKSKEVEIEAKSGSMETYVHSLDLSRMDAENTQKDILDQLGLTPFKPVLPAIVDEIIADSPAQRGGLQVGDEVVAVNGVAVQAWDDFVEIVHKSPGKVLNLQVKRQSVVRAIPVTPEAIQEQGQTIGKIGAASHLPPAEMDRLIINVRYSPLPALWHATEKTWETSVFSLKMFGNMLVGTASWKGVSGPLTIASYAGQSAHMGWKSFVGFLALVSISLGVLNLLPVPVLDGGHLMYYMVEILRGKPVSEHVMEVGFKVGYVLIGLLMLVALSNDINRFITG